VAAASCRVGRGVMAGKEHIRALMREIGPQMALAQVTEFEA
jgi:hypothetical protein